MIRLQSLSLLLLLQKFITYIMEAVSRRLLVLPLRRLLLLYISIPIIIIIRGRKKQSLILQVIRTLIQLLNVIISLSPPVISCRLQRPPLLLFLLQLVQVPIPHSLLEVQERQPLLRLARVLLLSRVLQHHLGEPGVLQMLLGYFEDRRVLRLLFQEVVD